jgi:hypothetical protein
MRQSAYLPRFWGVVILRGAPRLQVGARNVRLGKALSATELEDGSLLLEGFAVVIADRSHLGGYFKRLGKKIIAGDPEELSVTGLRFTRSRLSPWFQERRRS